jgi:protein-arginine kinase activator protein McsA
MICEKCQEKAEMLYETEQDGKTLIVCKNCFIKIKGFMRKSKGKIIHEEDSFSPFRK